MAKLEFNKRLTLIHFFLCPHLEITIVSINSIYYSTESDFKAIQLCAFKGVFRRRGGEHVRQ